MAKTHNHSVRFNKDHLLLYTKMNPGIKKPQAVVDQLLGQFWNQHHDQPAGKDVVKEEVWPKVIEVDTETFVENFKPGPPVVSKYEAFLNEIKECHSVKHVEAVAFLIKADKELSPTQKQKLEMEAREFSKTFEF